MSYFSRLTDIVTCNLSEILAKEENPASALSVIIEEMEEGLSGARRSVSTAETNIRRLKQELHELRSQIDRWIDRAKQSLAAGDENQARAAIARKQEQEDLIAGLEQQLQSAHATYEQLMTTLRALEARLSDARRRQAGILSGTIDATSMATETGSDPVHSATERTHEIDEELAALKKQLEDG